MAANTKKPGKAGAVIAGIIGLAVAIAIIAIQISAGFEQATAQGADQYVVNFLGMDMFQINKNATGGYTGGDIGAGIPLICILCVVVAVVIEQAIARILKH